MFESEIKSSVKSCWDFKVPNFHSSKNFTINLSPARDGADRGVGVWDFIPWQTSRKHNVTEGNRGPVTVALDLQECDVVAVENVTWGTKLRKKDFLIFCSQSGCHKMLYELRNILNLTALFTSMSYTEVPQNYSTIKEGCRESKQVINTCLIISLTGE